MLAPFSLPFVQRGLAEVLLLSLAAGVLGTWIALRGLAFYAHATAAAAFPGLVLADGLGFAAPLGALLTAGLIAAVVARRGDSQAIGLALVGALAAGTILASDVFHSGAVVDALLFGSLLGIAPSDIALAGGVALVAALAAYVLGPRWMARGFDPASTGPRADAALLILIAVTTVATLSAVGSMLSGALLVVPAITARLWTSRMHTWQAATVLLAAVEGTAGLWLSVEVNAPPGATIATLAAAVFVVAALARTLAARRAVAVAALALGVSGCGTIAIGGSDGKPLVVASTTQLGDIVREIAGADATVHQILTANADPHTYEPRPRDATAAADARLVVLSGNGLDRWMGKLIDEAGGHPLRLTLAPVHTPYRIAGEEGARYDPHWWHDPRNVEAVAPVIARALARIDPPHGADYRARAARYVARVRALDGAIAACMARIPAAQRTLVTSHDAFASFAHRYGIRVVGAVIGSQSTQAQPSAGQISKLAGLIRREHVRAVFPESSINRKLAEALARETGARADLTLYGDTLGPAGSGGATYLSMEAANADAMVRGFTGGRQRCRL